MMDGGGAGYLSSTAWSRLKRNLTLSQAPSDNAHIHHPSYLVSVLI